MKIITKQMSRIDKLGLKSIFILYIVLDIVFMGMGMGVPIFNIFFGFLVGWYLARRKSPDSPELKDILKKLLISSIITAFITFVGMVIIWGWSITLLLASDADIKNFGLPLILYSPRTSLIGWLILMIIISPFLQMLTTLFAGNITLLSINSKKKVLEQ
jgi:hypothetical protein